MDPNSEAVMHLRNAIVCLSACMTAIKEMLGIEDIDEIFNINQPTIDPSAFLNHNASVNHQASTANINANTVNHALRGSSDSTPINTFNHNASVNHRASTANINANNNANPALLGSSDNTPINTSNHNASVNHQASTAIINANNIVNPTLLGNSDSTSINTPILASSTAFPILAPQIINSQRTVNPTMTTAPIVPSSAMPAFSGAPIQNPNLTSKQNLPTAASNATMLKRSHALASGKNPSGNARAVAELDPENQEIVRLHQEEHLNWVEIASRLNGQRIAVGKEPTYTHNAVYSRYSRNAPRIAAARGEVWDPDQTGSKRKRARGDDGPVRGFDDAEDELLVRTRQEIEEETWELVRARIVAKGGRDHTADMCARRYRQL